MAEASTLAALATAGGTRVRAAATFSSTRSANRSARIAERSLQVGLRPVLFTARHNDVPLKVGYIDDHYVVLRDGLAAVQEEQGRVYLAIPLRNVGAGLAVLHGWRVEPRRGRPASEGPPSPLEFRRLQRDLYVPAGDVGFWQAAIRDPDDDLRAPLLEAMRAGTPITVDVLYGDHEGGQRAITRFSVISRSFDEREPWLWMCSVARHWNLDRADPR